MLDLSIYLSSKDLLDDVCVFQMLELLLETHTVARCKQIFQYFGKRIQLLTRDILPTKGKGLILLRMLNELLKRLSVNTDATFCGEIRMIMALVYPLTERSGVNLRGEFNLENVTRFEVNEGVDPESLLAVPVKLDEIMDNDNHNFYQILWGIQDYFRNPSSITESAQTFNMFQQSINSVLSVFKELFALDHKPFGNHQSSLKLDEQYFPKYLTGTNLLKLQVRFM